MKDFWIEQPQNQRKLNKKKTTITIISILVIIFIIVIVSIYVSNRKAREWIDINILRKSIEQNNVTTIDLNDEDSSKIYAYNKYIAILNEMKLKIYNNSGREETSLDISINNPIFNANNKYLSIAENKGQKIYLISGKDIIWENEIEGNISQIEVNKNGYVAVVITDTSHKAVVTLFDPNGKPLFNTYLSSTRTADISISNDNKYLAIAEIDTSGTIVQSNIKVISIEKGQNDAENSLAYSYKADANRLLLDIKYQDKNRIACMYADGIDVLENETSTKLTEISDKKISFLAIELNNNTVTVEETSSGLFTADSNVKIKNTTTQKENLYIVDEVAKEIYTYGDIIALNLGNEIHFINTGGWLVKEYISTQEITKVVLTDNIVGIVYRDKIEIINL